METVRRNNGRRVHPDTLHFVTESSGPQRAVPAPAPPGAWFIGLGAILVAAIVLVAAVDGLVGAADASDHVAAAIGLAAVELSFGVGAIVLARALHPAPRRVLGLVRSPWRTAGAIVGGGIVLVFVTGILWSLLVDEPAPSPTEDLGLTLTAVMAIGVAPLCEEVFFRGYLLSAVARTRLAERGAVVVQAGAFVLVHPVEAAGPIAILGLFLGWARVRTGSLWPGILLHLLNNTVAVSLEAFVD
jgi:membrane protease YdiL (CAAX protease family)